MALGGKKGSRRTLGNYHPKVNDVCEIPSGGKVTPVPQLPPMGNPFAPSGFGAGSGGGAGAPPSAPPPPATAQDLRNLANQTFVHVQPSPLVEPSFGADVLELIARAVIGPPTTPGNADATLGAIEIQNAEGALTGQVPDLLTPATVSDFVTVLTYDVEAGRTAYIKSVGANGHDYLSSRDMISWRIRVGTRVELNDTELGILGGIDNPIRVHALAYENERVTVECRNRDANSASLVELRLTGWTHPVVSQERNLASLMDRDNG